MKKLLFFLFALPLMLAVTSCSDDDDMPQVYLGVVYNSPVVDGEVYVVKPNEFKIDSVKVVAAREGHKATNGPVSYYIDGAFIGTNPISPYGVTIPTENMLRNKFRVQMVLPVYEEGCAVATIASSVVVNVVEDESDIPESTEDASEYRLKYEFQ